MFEYISGNIAELTPTYVVIDANGVGYFINISLNTYTDLQKEKDKVKVFVHQAIRDDAHLLYGFFKSGERKIFRHLISVSGIGPNSARTILSSLSGEELSQAIISGNVGVLKSVKGIGQKTAQRIILDLKDKLGESAADLDLIGNANTGEEAISALMALGFSKTSVEKVVNKIISNNKNCSVEEVVKQTLKGM